MKKLSRAATARRLSIDEKTLDRWRDRGCPQNADGSFDPAAVLRWKAAQKSQSAPSAQRGQIVLIRARCKDLERRILKIFGEAAPSEVVIAGNEALIETGRRFIARHMSKSGRHGLYYPDQALAALDELEHWTERLRENNDPIISFEESIQPIAENFDDIRAARETLAEMRARYLLILGNRRSGALVSIREFEEHTGVAVKRLRNSAMDYAGWPTNEEASNAMWERLAAEVLAPSEVAAIAVLEGQYEKEIAKK